MKSAVSVFVFLSAASFGTLVGTSFVFDAFAQDADAPAASAPNANASMASAPAISSAASSAAEVKPEPKPAYKVDLAKGQVSAAVCAACHAFDGSRGSPAYPILQGQHPEYIVKQLTEFRAGIRANAIMQGMAALLSEDDMKNVAAFYASKQAKAGFSKDKDLVSLGEKIYRGGIADRSIPACAGCHSPDGAGIPAQYPRLAGQHADYAQAQLTAFRGGVRKNSAPMMGVAAKMNDNEIKAVSDYVTGLH